MWETSDTVFFYFVIGIVISGILWHWYLYIRRHCPIALERPLPTVYPTYPIASAHEVENNAILFNTIMKDSTLTALMFNCFPNGITLSTKNHRPILQINGDDLNPVDWEYDLYFLSFASLPNYIVEMHFFKLSINEFLIKYLLRLFRLNANRIEVLSMIECRIQNNIIWECNLSFLSVLKDFKLVNTDLKEKGLEVLLTNLPSSLEILHVTMENIYNFKSIELCLERLQLLEELKLEKIAFDIATIKKSIIDLKHLKNISVIEADNIQLSHSEQILAMTQWEKVNLPYFVIPVNFCLQQDQLSQLVELDLSKSVLYPERTFNFISSNVSLFPNLKIIHFKITKITTLALPLQFIQSGIKLKWNYELIPMTMNNWENYSVLSTGIPITFPDWQGIINGILLKHRYGDSFDHVTDLTVRNCNSNDCLSSTLQLINIFPNLRFFSLELIDFNNFTNEFHLFSKQFNAIEEFRITSFDVESTENILLSFFKMFPNLKSIKILCRSLDLKNIDSIVSLRHLENLNLNCFIELKEIVLFSQLILKFPNLKILTCSFFQYECIPNLLTKSIVSSLKQLKLFPVKQLTFKVSGYSVVTEELKTFLSKFIHLTDLTFQISDRQENLESITKSLVYLRNLRTLTVGIIKTAAAEIRLIRRLKFLTQLDTFTCVENEYRKYHRLKKALHKLPYFKRFILLPKFPEDM